MPTSHFELLFCHFRADPKSHFRVPFLLGGRFGSFLFLFLLGGGEAGPRRQKGGGRGRIFLKEIPGGGGLPGERRRGGRGAGGCPRGFFLGGGEAKHFFRCRNAHQVCYFHFLWVSGLLARRPHHNLSKILRDHISTKLHATVANIMALVAEGM